MKSLKHETPKTKRAPQGVTLPPRGAIRNCSKKELPAHDKKVKSGDGKRTYRPEFRYGNGHVYVETVRALHKPSHYQLFWDRVRCSNLADAKRNAWLNRAKIEFLDTAGLTPVDMVDYHPDEHGITLDHWRVYRDAEGRLLLTSEPYNGWGDLKEAELTPLQGGWTGFLMPDWFGFWNPPDTRLIFLAPPGGADLAPIAGAALRSLKPIPREF